MSQDGIDSVVGKRDLFMCRIVSLFLLQRLKGSMSGDASDFNNMETRADNFVCLFFFVLFFPHPAPRQGAEGNSRHSERTIRGTRTFVYHRQNLGDPVYIWWFFHLWCASSSTTQNSEQLGDYWSNSELILEDHRISVKSIAEQLGISRERVASNIHEDLDMRKLSAEWVPKCLNADQKRQHCQSSKQHLEFFRRDPNDFLSRLLTMNET